MTHTPTPWRVAGQAGLTIVGEDSHPIADTCFVNDEANAAFIVRAVNSHAALVAALKAMTARFEVYAGPNWIHAGEHDKALLEQAAAALAAEKEEAA